jgi:hypothetical protein
MGLIDTSILGFIGMGADLLTSIVILETTRLTNLSSITANGEHAK